MKMLYKAIVLMMFITIAPAVQSKNLVPSFTNGGSEKLSEAEAQKLIQRLDEIKALDKTKMTKSEKRALRKEVKASQKRVNDGGGVYISVGVLLLIIILILIL